MIKNKLSFIALLIVLSSIFIGKYNHHQVLNKTSPYPIGYDVYGYYLYLPATFIYHDLGLEKPEWQETLRKKYSPSETYYQVADGINGKHVMVYDPGYAIIYLPGFLIANRIASVYGFEADGLSKPYQLSLILTALLVSFIGLFLLRKIVLSFFNDKISALLLLLIGLGTNYYYETAYNSTMPHNFLFTINCFILWFTIQWHSQQKLKYLLYLSLFAGLGFLCRATELIWLLFPLLWNIHDKASFRAKKKLLKLHKKQIFCFSLLLLIIMSVRFLYLYWATGDAFKLNYHAEKLTFSDPFTFKFLFSFRKGWLIYTPMMAFSIIGFYSLKGSFKTIWLSCFLFFLLNLYVVSSWECWWYAASFSQRPMVETYSIMALSLGALFVNLFSKKGLLPIVVLSICIVLVFLNQFQIWQSMAGILHPERTTKKYYLEVFGKTAFKHEFNNYLSVDHSQTVFNEYDHYTTNYIKTDSSIQHFENEDHSINNSILKHNRSDLGKKSLLMSGENKQEFSPQFNLPYKDITNKSYFWARASVWVYLIHPFNTSHSYLVATTITQERPTSYITSGNALENVPLYTWTKIKIDLLSPDIKHTGDKLSVYYWNPGHLPIIIDDLQVEVFEPKIDYE